MTPPAPPFTPAEFAARVAGTQAALRDRGIDLLLVSDPSNMNWLTGYDGWSFYVHQGVILPAQGEPHWWGRAQDAAGARLTTRLADDRIHGYADGFVQSATSHPMEDLARRVTDLAGDAPAIGVEMDNYWYTARAHAELGRALPGARFIDATGLVNRRRAVKSAAELALMRKAGRIVSRMHRLIAERAATGLRKSDLVAEIAAEGIRFDPAEGHGGDYPAIVPLLPSGREAAAPHLTWDDRPFRSGEATFFEIAGCVRRYHVPLSRTVFLGTPPREIRAAEEAVLEGMEAGLSKARAGQTCEDVARAFFAALERRGITKDNRTGYPIGLSYPPDWGERTMSFRIGDETVLVENMTFHFMTGLWMEDWGLEITESIRIGHDGPELLADVPRELVVKAG